MLTREMSYRPILKTQLPDHEELVMPSSPRVYRVGYARVSLSDQKLDSQFDALKQAGCHKVFLDRVSGVKADRMYAPTSGSTFSALVSSRSGSTSDRDTRLTDVYKVRSLDLAREIAGRRGGPACH